MTVTNPATAATGSGALVSQLEWTAQTATRAPSIFNTQPWQWRIEGDVLQLWADRGRMLDVVDPDGRLLTLSCGAALHHARTVLTAAGDQVSVEALPDPRHPDLLATLRITGTVTPSDADRARFDAIALRRTDRRPYTADPVPADIMGGLRRAAQAEGAYLQPVRAEQLADLAVAAVHAAEIQAADPAYRAQLMAWSRRPRWTGDGMPASTMVAAGPRRVPVRDFTLDGTGMPAGHGDDRGATFAILHGGDDAPAGWLRGGQALSAVMLQATADGLAVAPSSNLIEVGAVRERLRRRLLAGLGYPYLVLRIGYPQATRVPASPRRYTGEVINSPGYHMRQANGGDGVPADAGGPSPDAGRPLAG